MLYCSERQCDVVCPPNLALSTLLVITDITYRVHVIGRFHYPYTGRISTLELSV
jgi:hypothetical protein